MAGPNKVADTAGAAHPCLRPIHADPAGTVEEADLADPLPFGLKPRYFFQAVQDVHDLLHDVNIMLISKHHPRIEELVDRAGFSGLISRTVVERIASAAHGLAVNNYHNGYPDIIRAGQYPRDAVAHGEDGLEVKSSRKNSGWQSHGPRGGWFCIAQFKIDLAEETPMLSRRPTEMQAVMVARLEPEDWNWQPARAERIRSGTASIRPTGQKKLRDNAVWVDPAYRREFDLLKARAATRHSNTMTRVAGRPR